MTRNRRSARGFSIIETLAALSLLAIATAASVSLSVTTMRQTSANRAGLAAAFLAQQEMEHIRGHDYQNMANETYTQVVDGMTFTVNGQVASDTPVSGVSTVTVTISWTGNFGAKSYAIQSYFTDITA